MGLILIFIVAIIIGGILKKVNSYGSSLEFASDMLIVFGAIFLFIALIYVPMSLYCAKTDIEQYKQTKITIEEQRNNKEISELERASLLTEIIKQNEGLISYQRYNATFMFGIYVPDEIDNLELLK